MGDLTWLIGAVLAAVGSICSNLGVNCQKYSFMQNAKLPKAAQKRHIRQKGWLFGMLLVVLGSLGDFAALSLAAQSIVAPIGSITLVANVFFAHYWLKEVVGWVELCGTAMIVCGSVTAVAFGDHSDVAYDIHAILRFFYGTTFIIYALASLILGVSLYYFQLPITPIKQKMVDATKRYELAYDAHDTPAMEYEDFYIASLSKSYSRWEKVHPFAVCALSGILGGQSVMFGKMVSEMINVTASGDNQLLSPLFYLFIACMLACVVGQLQYLAIALNFFDALYVVPVFQCFFISFSTLGGASFFSEFSNFNALQAVMFPLGLLFTLGGVVVLTRRKMEDAGNRLKRMVAEGEELRVGAESDEMEVIEEEDEAALREEEEGGRGDVDDSSRGENEVLKMEQRRLKKERKRRRRLRRKQGGVYQGLEGDEEDVGEDDASLSPYDTSETDSEEEEEKEEEEEEEDFTRRFKHITPLPHSPLPPRLPHPEGSPIRPSPARRLSQRHSPPSSASTPPNRSPSSSPRTLITPLTTPLPNIDDLMGAAAIATPSSSHHPALPTSTDRRSSLSTPSPPTTSTTIVERRASLDRRHSLPRRPSRSPGPLLISADDPSTPSSAPSTPSSLHRIYAAGGSSSPLAGSLMSPHLPSHTTLHQYMPPPQGLELWSKGEAVADKVKKYSSLAHHAGGLVGVPIVSAIAHAYAIAREEREEEKKEKEVRDREGLEEKERREEKDRVEQAQLVDDSVTDPALSFLHSTGGATVEMEEMHHSGAGVAGGGQTMGSVSLPVAEPVEGGGGGGGGVGVGHAAPHHQPQPSIYGRLKDRLLHVFEGGKGGEAKMEGGGGDAATEGKGWEERVEGGDAGADAVSDGRHQENAAVSMSDAEAGDRTALLPTPTVGDEGSRSDAEHGELTAAEAVEEGGPQHSSDESMAAPEPPHM